MKTKTGSRLAWTILAAAATGLGAAAPLQAQSSPQVGAPTLGPGNQNQRPEATKPASPAAHPAPAPPPRELSPLEYLYKKVQDMEAQLAQSRKDLADARLEAANAKNELAELRQFMADHHDYGADFEKYKELKEIAAREDARKQAEAARQKREAERAERIAKMNAARAAKTQQDAASMKVSKYRHAGFSPLGLDVFSGKMAYFYESKDVNRTRIDYDPFIGSFLRPAAPFAEIDYSKMTISGSVLNASDQVRHLGVAITFFDDNGNQVGHETVEIKNARPDVPYPFTSKIDMALNRAFSSSSIYVLYADPAEDADDGSGGAGGMGGGQYP